MVTMAYGFNLGQIEGLDSSVQTVAATIANATESNTYTLNKANENPLVWSDGPDPQSTTVYIKLTEGVAGLYVAAFTESDVGDTYNVTLLTSAVEENFKSAVETVLVDNGLISEPETLFDGTITITDGPVEIPFVMDVSSYPFEKWMVTVNDESLEYNGEVFYEETETHTYIVGNNNGVYKFFARDADGVIPGDYQVKIVAQAGSGGGGSSGLPDVTKYDEGKQLTVVNGEWSKNGYIDVTIDRRDTSVSPNIIYTVHFHRQGKLVRVNSNAIPMSLFTDIVIPQGYRPDGEYDGVRQLILNVDDNSVEWAQFDAKTKKFIYSGSSTGQFLIDFTYFTYDAFPTE